MPDIEILALSPRTATVMLAPSSHLYRLDSAMEWRLQDGQGALVSQGVSQIVPLFLDGLTPDIDYTLVTALGEQTFRTTPCAGKVDVTEFGADPQAANNAQAFAHAIAAVPKGGTLNVPAGRFMTGPIFLRSDMTLHLEEGSEIAAIADRADWPILQPYDAVGRNISTWEGLPEASFAAVVTAIGCNTLTITGKGRIDGGGGRGDWWTWPKETRQGARRPRTLFLSHCSDVTLSGITVCNSPSWTVHPFRCDRLLAAAMTIENPHDSPNTDGFDPESCLNTTVRGLRISVGDDCIAVKAGKRLIEDPDNTAHLAPTRHLHVSNCLMERGHGAVVLGSEMSGEITDVSITRCVFEHTDRGLRIKTRRGRGGKVARVTLDTVQMDRVGTGFAVNAFYFCDADGKSDAVQSRDPAPVDPRTTPHIHDITLKHVQATRVQHAAVALLGLPEAPITAIRLEDFTASFDPDATEGEALMACHVPPMRHVATYSDFAEREGDVILVTPKEPALC